MNYENQFSLLQYANMAKDTFNINCNLFSYLLSVKFNSLTKFYSQMQPPEVFYN